MTFDIYKLLLWKSNDIKFLSVPHLEIKAGHHMLSGYILLEKVTIQEIELLSKRAWC